MAAGLDGIDRRRKAGQAALDYRDELLVAQGGADVVSPQVRGIVTEIALLEYLAQYADAYIVALRSPLVGTGTKKRFVPIVRERMKLSKQKAQLLQLIGLERRSRQLPSAIDIIRANGNGDAP